MTEQPKPATMVEAEPFIPYVPEDEFDPRLEPFLTPYKARMGFLPNALRLYAHRPDIAETLWKLNSNIMRDPSSTLDQFLKRRLAAVACRTNGCAYCTAHSCSMLMKERDAQAEGWGMSKDEVRALVDGDLEPQDEFERVCFDYVRAASFDAPNMPDDIFPRLQALLSPAQIVELACVVGFWKFYNTVHDSLRIPVEAALLEDTQFVKEA